MKTESLETRALLAAFTAGNLAIYRVGDGAATLSNSSTAAFIDEYTPTGTFVQSIVIPTADSGANQSLTNSGTATSEGALSLSADGQFLTFGGYDAAPGVASIASTTAAANARVLGRVDASGNVNTSTTTTSFSGNNIRSVTSTNGTDLWSVGATTGVVYNTLGSSGAGTLVSSNFTNIRVAQVAAGQLYVSSGSSTLRLGTVGTGTPTTTGQTTTNLPGFPTSGGSPYGYFFADLNAGVAGIDTLYVADDGVGVTKYSLVSGSWTANGTVGLNADDYRGLTGSVSAGTVTLYATRDSGGNPDTLVSIVDASGYNVAFSATPTTLVTGAANTAMRGIAFAPQSANQAPTGIALSNNSLAENAGANATVGTLSATDPNSGDTFTFSLPAGVDNNSLFNVSGTSLRGNASFDFEFGATYTVTARVADAGGLTFDKQFTITITNVNETPTITSGTSFSSIEANTLGITGPSSSATPYLTSTNSNVQFTSVLTVGDSIGGYRMVGIPDGMGAFDNGDGTFTLLLNHELNNAVGINRAHGNKGAFVSRWVINKATLQVVSIQDFLGNGTSIFLSNNDPANGTAHTAYLAAASTVISRLCSADLAPVSAYQWDNGAGTVFGTAARIFQSGEESGGTLATPGGPEAQIDFGRQFAFIATDDPNTAQNEANTAYELPHAGLFSWENNLANPLAQRKTIVMGMDDGNVGQLYVWVGDKQTTGNVVERAGLTKQGPNDNLFVVRVPSLVTVDGTGDPLEDRSAPVGGAFTLVNEGDVSGLTFNGLEGLSDGHDAAQFLRPEDGQWDPNNPSDFYFVTTDRYDQVKDGIGSQIGRSRMYKLHFTDIANPELGGTITAVLDGTEAGNMFDNMTIDGNGIATIQEDVGNQQHLGKIWQYNIATDTLTQIAQHDRARFGDVGVAAAAPFNQDEESSGVIDMSAILGPGTYLLNVQAHYNAGDAELVEGGQLLFMRTNVATGSQLVTTVTATDAESNPLTFSISGGADAADFLIDPATGRLSFVIAPNFEAPADADTNNIYEVTVSVSDGTNPAVTQTILVTVTAVNESPTNTTVETVSIPENTTAVTTASGSDPEGVALTYAISGGADGGKFTIVPATGVLTFLTAPNFEVPTDNGANNSYFVTVTVSDGVNPPVNRTVVVTVTNVNEVPVANASSVTTNEDTARTFAASDFLFTDAEGNSLVSVVISGLTLAVGDLLTVNQGTGQTPVGNGNTITAAQLGTLKYQPAANAGGSPRSTFLFSVNDAGGSGTVTAAMTLNVTALNDVPVANDIRLSSASTTTVTNGAEISAFDKGTRKLFVTKNDGGVPSLDVIDLTNPAAPGVPVNINLTAFGGSISSVAAKNGLVVAAMIATIKTAPGTVVFIDAATHSILGSVAVTSQPDMITFTPDGSKVLVAIEGEAADNVTPTVNNPEGGVAIITPNLSNLSSSTVSFAGFSAFDSQKAALVASGVRLLSNASVTVAMDLEPEYIAISADGTTARVTLQEANAFGVLNLLTGAFTAIQPLGAKDYSLPGNEIDASDRDVPGSSNNPVAGNLRSWPVMGFYMPDAVASFSVAGQTYYVTANEGDARPNAADTADTDVLRVSAATLDPTLFPNAAFLKDNDNLGRLNVLTDGDIDGDGDLDRLISLGGRSFTIWDGTGAKVYDSGSDFERITFAQTPTFFNANNGVASAVDQRSDDKGPEPEGVVIGEINGRSYAFIGLERAGGGVMVYDVTTPTAPVFVQYIRNNGDISPEGIVFISSADSPVGQPLLVLSNEVSGTVTVYQMATSSVTTNEDIARTFAVSDFLFTDVESDSLVSITISSLNLASGDTLKLGGTDVTINQTITAANIASLVYTPAAEASGLARSAFGFKVNDGGLGTVGATMTINVTAVNDSPTISSGNAFSVSEANTNGVTGPSSSATPYLTSTNPNVQFTSIMTVGDAVSGYRMVGIPDGMGAYDNNDGTFTLLLNHELNNTVGINRAHGQKGSFVSRWVINKSTLQVVSIQDLLQNGTSVFLSNNNQSMNTVHSGYLAAATTIISRLCSADLAAPTAYQWTDTGTGTVYGTSARIFQSGEESSGSVTGIGPETTTLFGRQFAFIATDDPNTAQNEAGTAYELPHAGLFAWENNLANPLAQRKTIVMGMDDGSPIGQVYMWVGDKQTTGNVVERAGLTKQGANDNMYVLRVPSLATVDGSGVPIETLGSPVSGAFTMVNEGDVSGLTFAGLEALSDSHLATQFLRPEDGQWDPDNPSDFYFVTTSNYDQTKDGVGSTIGRSRLYKLSFTDIAHPELGGTITALLDGTEAGNMFDNMTVSNGKAILQEDPGNQQHLAKVWEYDIATDTLTELAQHDRARFGDVGVAAVSPFSQDEESSGVIDMSEILGAGTYLVNVQAHYNVGDTELVEGGQLLLMRTNVTSGTQLVTTITATDADADTLTYSISGGADAADFVIDSATGKLSFAVAPNFESPADADTNNVYLVDVSVNDGTSTVTQTLSVTVTNANESPSNTTAATVSVAENTTAVTTATGTDPESATLAFAISGGADAAKFSINPVSGALTFISAPNFEAPTDNGANNSYFVTVTVSDGVNPPVNKTVVVTVTDVNEATFSTNVFYNLDAAAEKNFSLDRTGQRSIISHIQVVFNGNVAVQAGAVGFTLTKGGPGGGNIGLTVTSQVFDGTKTTVVLGFTSGTKFGSLLDGDYRLDINYGALGIDGDGDGLVGGVRTTYFHRFFGDSDGDRDTDASDAARFRGVGPLAVSPTVWRSLFDYDNDGSTAYGADQDDFDAFFGLVGNKHYGKRLADLPPF